MLLIGATVVRQTVSINDGEATRRAEFRGKEPVAPRPHDRVPSTSLRPSSDPVPHNPIQHNQEKAGQPRRLSPHASSMFCIIRAAVTSAALDSTTEARAEYGVHKKIHSKIST